MNKKLAKLVLIASPCLIAYSTWTVATSHLSRNMDIAIVASTLFLIFATGVLISRYKEEMEKD